MALSIKSLVTPCNPEKQIIARILDYLATKGYEPLISRAKRRYVESFGVSQTEVDELEQLYPDRMYQQMYVRHFYVDSENTPLAGELFFSTDKSGFYYITLNATDPRTSRRRSRESQAESNLEVGVIAENVGSQDFEGFTIAVSNYLKELGIEPAWNQIQPLSPQFVELSGNSENKFILASSLSADEINIAKTLEDVSTRNLAIVVKRAGGILASDLTKKSGINAEDTQNAVERLSATGLLAKEYVVICKRTSNQINRLDSKEKIETMSELGVLCSCGNSIAQERIEELFSATPTLQKMLDQSYWMSASLVQSLKDVHIPENRILLNLQEGAEEIDAFVDFEGTLIMVELKDNEFSMGHAYPFGGRIGLYKPAYAVIVSTKGIAPDVREYFNRIKPGAEIVYVGSLSELDNNLRRITTQISSRKAVELLAQFEPMANVQIPLAQLLTRKIGTKKIAASSAD